MIYAVNMIFKNNKNIEQICEKNIMSYKIKYQNRNYTKHIINIKN